MFRSASIFSLTATRVFLRQFFNALLNSGAMKARSVEGWNLRESMLFSEYDFENLYSSTPLKVSTVRKPNGTNRMIYNYNYRDRLLSAKLCSSLSPEQIRSIVSKNSYGISKQPVYYALKNKVKKYKRAIKNDTNLFYIVGDFKNFADSIPKSEILTQLENVDFLSSQQKQDFSYFVSKSMFLEGVWSTSLRGLHSGVSAINLLWNFFLRDFDSFVDKSSQFFVRVGDDFFVVCDNKASRDLLKNYIQSFTAQYGMQVKIQDGDLSKPHHYEFLSYVFNGNPLELRPKSVARFLHKICTLLQPINASLDRKQKKLKTIYYKTNGLKDTILDFLYAYPYLESDKQAKFISNYVKARINYYLFAYKGKANSSELEDILKELGIISLYSYFWRLKTGRLKYNRKILNRFDEK